MMPGGWVRSLAVIDSEIHTLEAKLARALAAQQPGSARGWSAQIATLHARLADLWKEREAALARLDARAG
jgi:hypothetical protein